MTDHEPKDADRSDPEPRGNARGVGSGGIYLDGIIYMNCPHFFIQVARTNLAKCRCGKVIYRPLGKVSAF